MFSIYFSFVIINRVLQKNFAVKNLEIATVKALFCVYCKINIEYINVFKTLTVLLSRDVSPKNP